VTGQRIVPAGGNEAGLAHRFKLLKKAERSDRNGGETSKRPSQRRACRNRSGNDPDPASSYSNRD
jgi:hypothetical protein